MNTRAKFVLANTLFFGIIGSYVGGIIPFLIMSHLSAGNDGFVLSYLITSPTIGLIPGCLTGYFYSKTLKKEHAKTNLISFKKAIKTAFLTSLSVMLSTSLLLGLFFAIDSHLKGVSPNQIGLIMKEISVYFLLLTSTGVISASCCACLTMKWNKATILKMQ